VLRIKSSMNYRPKNRFSISCMSRKVIFHGVVLLPPQDRDNEVGVVDFRLRCTSLSILSSSGLSGGGDRPSSKSSIGLIGRDSAFKSYLGGSRGAAGSPLESSLPDPSMSFIS